jgi:large subunit ribosomal protein L21
MFAVIQTGGKQYKVCEGDQLDIELIDLKEGAPAVFDQVLMIGKEKEILVGKPTVAGAQVTAEVLGEVKGDKVIAFKFKRRKGYHRTVGHRQKHLRVKVSKIKA